MNQGLDFTTNRVAAARMDRTVFEFGTLDDDGERDYWLSRTPEERRQATQHHRQINDGDAAMTGRLQRVFEFAELGEG
ncbi:MAG: hypothetical protein FLDDKLPJ_02802 [Phycisphaerae bacterium]|nr:hypothetical protein [Phycisphaerae bacterium]